MINQNKILKFPTLKSIESVDVPYEVKRTDGTINRTSKRFTDKEDAIRFRNENRSTCVVGVMKKK